MNVFIIATQQPSLQRNQIRATLRQMIAVYPHLDSKTLWDYCSADRSVQAASISIPSVELAPRKLAYRTKSGVTFYSGLPVDSNNEHGAHDATVLSRHWNALKNRLEGTYSVVRIRQTEVEIQTDLLGGEAVYHVKHNGGWLFSNSVLLLEKLTGYKPLDELGVSMYLQLGYALGDRTLRRGIRVMGAAQRWTLNGTQKEPQKNSYYSLANLANLPHQQLTNNYISTLAEQLQQPLRNLSEHFKSVVCPLTGGKDSRVIASLLMDADIRAKYYTFGDPRGDDARIAATIAREFELEHIVKPIDESDVFETWDEKCLQTVRSTDGMRSLYLLGGMSKTDPISEGGRDIHLWGACGEVARGFYGNLPFLKRDVSLDDIKTILDRSGPADSFSMVRESAKNRAIEWKNQCVEHCSGNGISALDIPDVFGTLIIDARRLSNNGRGLAAIRDTYTPYGSRAFLEAAFSMSAKHRFTEPLHNRILQVLSPGLHTLPFDKGTWRFRNPYLNIANLRSKKKFQMLGRQLRRARNKIRPTEPKFSYVDSMFSRSNWFEGKRMFMREFALDSANSSVWDYVDRSRFEQLTSSETSAAVRSQNLKLLFHVVTLLYYDTDSARKTAANDVAAHVPAISVA